jgi:hypothetical protein
VPSGCALVAVTTGWAGQQQTTCPSASLLAGELERRGIHVAFGPLPLRLARSGDAVAYALAGRPPHRWAMAVAIYRHGPPQAACLAAVRAWSRARHSCDQHRRIVLAPARDPRDVAVGLAGSRPDVALAIGSPAVAIARRLADVVEIADRYGVPAYRIEDATDIRPEWVADAVTIAITTTGSAAAPRPGDTHPGELHPGGSRAGVIAALAGLGPTVVVNTR